MADGKPAFFYLFLATWFVLFTNRREQGKVLCSTTAKLTLKNLFGCYIVRWERLHIRELRFFRVCIVSQTMANYANSGYTVLNGRFQNRQCKSPAWTYARYLELYLIQIQRCLRLQVFKFQASRLLSNPPPLPSVYLMQRSLQPWHFRPSFHCTHHQESMPLLIFGTEDTPLASDYNQESDPHGSEIGYHQRLEENLQEHPTKGGSVALFAHE